MSLMDQLSRPGGLRPLDHALAQVLRRLGMTDTGSAPPEPVLAAAGLASLAVAQGHAGFELARPSLLLDGPVDWPDPQQWRDALALSPWVSTPAADEGAPTTAPLVMEQGLVYLRRYREYERRLAQGLLRIAAAAPAGGDVAALAPVFAALFPAAAGGADAQARAAALALLRSLLLVTGGPGTGKTTTIARMLVLLLEHARAEGRTPPRIALAAPTGRAADRMAGSMRSATAMLDGLPLLDGDLLAALPTRASTLHRLLGTIPDSPRFRHDADHPLPFDVVVVDEASMVDLPLMCKLVEAVPDGCRLVLLGDPDQLPSVEAGDVLSGILRAAGGGQVLAVADATRLQPLLGEAPAAQGNAMGGGLAGHRVHLHRGYRQSSGLQLSPLADAVRTGDADAALALLRGGLAGVDFHEGALDPLLAGRGALVGHWRALASREDPATALRDAGQMCLLTALREGPQGARGLNARIEELLGGRQSGYFQGRLLQVTENSYRHRLFNGDVGICMRDASGAMVAWFAGDGDGDGGLRGFHPGALPAHESAFAMTVHKAQGSEFDEVWLQLPRQPSKVLSRELVYTALTRARSALHLCADETVLREALSRHSVRVSGLAVRLGAAAS